MGSLLIVYTLVVPICERFQKKSVRNRYLYKIFSSGYQKGWMGDIQLQVREEERMIIKI